MANRVTGDEVAHIIDVEDGADLVPFIDVANRYVTRVLGSELTEAVLTDIELYMSAHLVALSSEGGAVTQERVGSSMIQFATSAFGKNLESTRYGQMAVILDTSGTLVSEGKKKAKMEMI